MTQEAHFENSDDLDLSVTEEIKDRELYEKEKTLLLRFLLKVESTLDTSSESVEQALEPKEACVLQLRSTLAELKDMLKVMTDLNYKLRRKVSRKYRQQLRQEIVEFDKCFSGVEKQLNFRLDYLETKLACWKDWYRRLHEFCDWLLGTQAKLAEMENSHSTGGIITSSETCVQEAQVLHDQVHKNRDTLTQLEKDLQNMTSDTADTSALECSPLLSNLSIVRLKWELLQTRSRDFIYKVFASSLEQFQKLTHWKNYEELKKRLVLWLGEAEKRSEQLTTECVTSMEEAVNVWESYQVLLREHEEHHTTLQDMQMEVDYLVEHPAMREELANIQNRWDSLRSVLGGRSDRVRTLCSGWLSPEDTSTVFEVTADLAELSGDSLPTLDTTIETESEDSLGTDSDRLPRHNGRQLSLDLEEGEGSGLAKTSAERITAEHRKQKPQQQDATNTEPERGELTSESSQPKVKHRQGSRTPPIGVRAIFDALISKQVNQDKESSAKSASELKLNKPDVTRLPETEATVSTLQKCILHSSQAIFPHQMTDRLNMLKSALSDYNQHASGAHILQQELEDFLKENADNNNADETHRQQPQEEVPSPVTVSRASNYLKLLRRLAKIGDMLEARVTVCDKWVRFNDLQDSSRAHLQSQLDKLSKEPEKSTDNVGEVEEIKSEVQKVRKTLEARREEAVSLGKWMSSTQLQVKDPTTHNLIQPRQQLQELEHICDTIEHLGETKSQPEGSLKTDLVSPSEERCPVVFSESEMTPRKEEIPSCGEFFREDDDEVISPKEGVLTSEQLYHEDGEIVSKVEIPSHELFVHEDEAEKLPVKEETMDSKQSCSEEDNEIPLNDEIHGRSDGDLVFTLGAGITPNEENLRFDPSGRNIVLASGEEEEDILSSNENVNCTEC